jgi:hypothetical protein
MHIFNNSQECGSVQNTMEIRNTCKNFIELLGTSQTQTYQQRGIVIQKQFI